MDNFTILDMPKKAMLESLKKNLGIIAAACRDVGITRQTHYNWLANCPSYKQAIEDIGEDAIDFVEGKLFSNIQNGDTTAAIFYLKTKGKKRGYVERQEIDHSGAIQLPPINFIESGTDKQ